MGAFAWLGGSRRVARAPETRAVTPGSAGLCTGAALALALAGIHAVTPGSAGLCTGAALALALAGIRAVTPR